MKTVVTIDDQLYEQALQAADGSMDMPTLVHEALETFVRVRAAQRLAALGGTMSDAQDIRRQRDASDSQ